MRGSFAPVNSTDCLPDAGRLHERTFSSFNMNHVMQVLAMKKHGMLVCWRDGRCINHGMDARSRQPQGRVGLCNPAGWEMHGVTRSSHADIAYACLHPEVARGY